MKPVFKEEIEFFKSKTNIELPEYCWRDGKSFYLNSDKKDVILKFNIVNGEIKIKKNRINEVIQMIKNKTFEEEIIENNERLNMLEKISIDKTKECLETFIDSEWRVSDSGGKDSALCYHIFKKAFDQLGLNKPYEVDFFNTSNEVAETYLHIKNNMRSICSHQLEVELGRKPDKLEIEERFKVKSKEWIHNPEMGWYQWLKEVKNYYIPSIMVRNCCSTYKEGNMKKTLDKNKNIVLFLGMRKYESTKRAEYDYYLNDKLDKLYEETGLQKYRLFVPRNWVRFLPVVEWTDVDVWLYMIRENINFNKMYKYGFNRIGCCICPYGSDYVDLIIQHIYPQMWDRWCGIVEKNYELYNVERRLKWTKYEYIQGGKWKQSTSKEIDIISKKATPARVKELAELKQCSEEIAKKFFKKECSCGKKLNPDEIAMYLKLFGRYEYSSDERSYLCKECTCKELGMTKDEYSEKIKEFRYGGCNLF